MKFVNCHLCRRNVLVSIEIMIFHELNFYFLVQRWFEQIDCWQPMFLSSLCGECLCIVLYLANFNDAIFCQIL